MYTRKTFLGFIGLLSVVVLSAAAFGSVNASTPAPENWPVRLAPTQMPIALVPKLTITPMPTAHPTVPPQKGIGLTYGFCEDAQAVGATWQYGWGPKSKNCAGLENVPMIWGKADAKALLAGSIKLQGNSDYILGFNEPDLRSQAYLSPQEAADLWYQLEKQYPDKRLVSPAMSRYDFFDVSGEAERWLPQFRDLYHRTYGGYPRFDALAVHCYASPAKAWTSCQELIRWYEQKAVEWGVSGGIWVTEYGFPADQCRSQTGCEWSAAVDALNRFTDWLKTRPQVRRYAWFAARIQGSETWWNLPNWTTRLVDCPDGSATCKTGSRLSPLGAAYLLK
jgi:hypothetical protein